MLDVAIIGAGPYGLSAAAHLRPLRGAGCRTFGEPMSFWAACMPEGMLLRSPWTASHLADPAGSLTLDAYADARAHPIPEPIPLGRFVDYGRWFQRLTDPEVDRRRVVSLRRERGAFHLTLETGETERARRVVVAAGIGPFAHVPDEFRGLPRELVSHSRDHRDLSAFTGRRVAVLGAGQSALETAALLAEGEAEAEVISRRRPVRFLRRSSALHALGPVSRLLYSPADVGPAGISRIAGFPGVYRRLPRAIHDAWRRRCTRPAGALWLEPRLRRVAITAGVRVERVQEGNGGVTLSLSDGTRRSAHHVILATGYRVDITRYPFLSPALREAVRCVEGYPCLSEGFESSVHGLHFLGAPAGWTFGPLMHFVAGTGFAVRALSRFIDGGGGASAGKEWQ